MKFPIEKKENLREKIKELHPYEIPQWVVLAARNYKRVSQMGEPVKG